MVILAIDTSSPLLSVAVRNTAKNTVQAHEERAGQTHAERLPSVCDDVLLQAGVTYKDITAIVVGSGPGSFTGLRIGYAFAKGLASSLMVPLVACSSYHAFYASHPEITTVLGDARSDLFFYGYQFEEPRLLRAEALSEAMQQRPTSSVISVDSMPKAFAHLATIEPSGIATQLLGLSQLSGKEVFSIRQVSEMTPDYLRAAAAKTIVERSMLTPR